MLLGRILSGVGEASFQCIVPAFIDDYASVDTKGKWLSVFYSGIPIGYALGYILSGIYSDTSGSWRYPFMIELAAMFPFIIYCFFITW